MEKVEKSKPGCFSSFIRVLLCAGNGTSPPVHPSDQVTEIDEAEQKAHSNKVTIFDEASTSTTTPGVVARLMGLDSLPKTKWVVKGTTPDSIPRSRSVNFVDYLLEFDLSQAKYHRRVRTSASFREVPALAQREKSDLFVLYMDEDQQVKPEMRKLEMGLGELKQRKRQGSKKKENVSVKKERNQGKKNKKISKLRNEPRRVPFSMNDSKEVKNLQSVSSSSSKNCTYSYRYSGASSSSRLKLKINSQLQNKEKKGFVEPKIRKSMRNQNAQLKIERECSLENHSPISVLESNDYPFLCEADSLDGTSTSGSKSKWVSLGDDIEEERGSSSNNNNNNNNNNNKDYGFMDVNKEAEYYSEIMLKLRTLTEQDIGESDCTLKPMCESESFKEICSVLELKIFDLLLYEVVNEVLELYY